MTRDDFLQQLQEHNIDTTTAISRFVENVDMYISFLKKFPKDDAFEKLEKALIKNDYLVAFEAAHTLKGVCGNLGIDGLFDLFSKMVASYRNSDFAEMQKLMPQTKKEYNTVCSLVNSYQS